MHSSSLPPSFASLLSRCAHLKDLRHGASLHAGTIKAGSNTGNFLGNAVVSLYAGSGRLAEATLAFEEIEDRDVASWNCLINSYSRQGLQGSLRVLELFRRMRAEDPCVVPNSFTLTGVFTATSCLPDMGDSVGEEVHAVAVKTGNWEDVFVGSSLVNMYCKVGFLEDARKVFDRMPVRNLVSWATMISGYAAERNVAGAFELFKLMVRDGECCMNEFVLTSVLSAVALPEFSQFGKEIQVHALKTGLSSFVAVRNSLLTMYTKCGFLDDARRVFEFSSDKNTITWSALVTGYVQNGRVFEALSMFSSMHSAGVMPSGHTFVGVFNACSDSAALLEGKQTHAYLLKLGLDSQLYIKSALVDMYAKCCSICDARKGFNQISDPDVVLWTTMIAGYVQNGENKEALVLYLKMGMDGTPPNDLTLASVLRASSCVAALELGKQIHAHSVKYGFGMATPIGSALSTMYAKCGDIDASYLVFKRMPSKDVVAWNSIISGFAQNGCGLMALKLFDEMKMEGVEPNDVTFVNLLSACSHMGFVDKGWDYFKSMSCDYGLTHKIEHYGCMVDILSRAGLLEEAKSFVDAIPIDHGPHLWHIILGASANHRNSSVGAYAGERLLQLGTNDWSVYILLSNIYGASGRREDIERVGRMMRFQGVNKEPGCSWVEVKNRVHVFLVKDQMHPDIERVYAVVKSLNMHMRDERY